MKLYHGSPKDLDILKPYQAKGTNDFENMNALFLTDDFSLAALYAIGKTLKGQTAFGFKDGKLIIVGDFMPGDGYVYEVDMDSVIEGERRQFASEGELWPIGKKKVLAKDYADNIIFVNDRDELKLKLGI